jgi:NhaA family Na+:H+ antiporter
MAIPRSDHAVINWNAPQNLSGWGIPAATDIAFALAVLSLLNNGIPSALKVLLLAIAIFDNLGAILIIGFFYTAQLSQMALVLALLPIAGLIILNRTGVRSTASYVLLGVLTGSLLSALSGYLLLRFVARTQTRAVGPIQSAG